jgi:hypothetical protein
VHDVWGITSSSNAAQCTNNGMYSITCRNPPTIGSASADGRRIKNRRQTQPPRPSKHSQQSWHGTTPAPPEASKKGWTRPSPCSVWVFPASGAKR